MKFPKQVHMYLRKSQGMMTIQHNKSKRICLQNKDILHMHTSRNILETLKISSYPKIMQMCRVFQVFFLIVTTHTASRRLRSQISRTPPNNLLPPIQVFSFTLDFFSWKSEYPFFAATSHRGHSLLQWPVVLPTSVVEK